jgi:Topoisomerase IA
MTGNRHRTSYFSSSTGAVTVLNVAEKPSVARALASVFRQMSNGHPGDDERPSASSSSSSRSVAPLFTSHNVSFPNIFTQALHTQQQRQQQTSSNTNAYRPHTMITTSVRGHLATQDFPKEYGWNQCHPSALFHAPIETSYSADMMPLKEMLERQSESVDAIILWLDCDREGEAIAWEVQQVCLGFGGGHSRGGGGGRARVLTPDRVYRAQFSTVLPQEIQRALHNLTRINMNFVNAVQARSEHDLRVGAAFTRFQTLRLQKLFDEFVPGGSRHGGGGGGGGNSDQHHQGVVSYGPCQFPTLGFVVERWARIETFVPEDFWYLEMSMVVDMDVERREDGIVGAGRHRPNDNRNRPLFLKWKRDRLYDRVLTMVLYESCLDAQQATVIGLTGRPKNKWRPVPLATVELQKRASRYLRIGSERLMTAAEELYQAGLISYPRTETEKFRPEFQHIPLIQSFQALEGDLGDYASKLLTGNHFQIPRAGRNDDAAHPPITPCKAVDPNSIADRTQRDVYVLIVKHYLACCSRDAVGKETVLTVKMASEEFTAKGLMILERNWLEIYSPWERWSTGQGEIPALQVGSRFTPTALLMKDGRTTPPNPISGM